MIGIVASDEQQNNVLYLVLRKKIKKKKGQLCMNKLRVATFHHLIIIGGAAVFFHYWMVPFWLDMPTNLHVRLWELVAKISADTLSFRNSFFTISKQRVNILGLLLILHYWFLNFVYSNKKKFASFTVEKFETGCLSEK